MGLEVSPLAFLHAGNSSSRSVHEHLVEKDDRSHAKIELIESTLSSYSSAAQALAQNSQTLEQGLSANGAHFWSDLV